MITRLNSDEKTTAKKLAREILADHMLSLAYWGERNEEAFEKMSEKEKAEVEAEVNKLAGEIFAKYQK